MTEARTAIVTGAGKRVGRAIAQALLEDGWTVVAHVHHGRFVHVTGIQGDWLQVTLRNGTVGFIPVSAAE